MNQTKVDEVKRQVKDAEGQREDRGSRIATPEDMMTSSPEELLEAACRYYDKLPGTWGIVMGMRIGFKIANPDEGWKEVAPAWLAELREASLCNLRKQDTEEVRRLEEGS